MWRFTRSCLLFGFGVFFTTPPGLLLAQTPDDDPATIVDPAERSESVKDSDRPLVLPPKTRPAQEDQTLDYWVQQLGHDQFLRREMASRKLAQAGPEAIPALVEVMKGGDLETVERAVFVMSEIALAQPPHDDGGAWGELNKLADHASGIRASRSGAAIEEIREHRAKQARAALAAAGIFVGIDEFIVGSISQPQMIVQIDEKWHGEMEAIQWLRWLDGIEFARIKGHAARREVFQELVRVPDLRTLAIVDATVDLRTLEPLLKMPRINSLEFLYVDLTPEICDMIVMMPIRVSLNLMGTGVTADKVEAMRGQLPGLLIDHKMGGFLGVKCHDRMEVCQITDVVRGGAAEAAGMIPGDVIVHVGKYEVHRFRDLQNAINQHVAGDELEVKFRRGDSVQSVTLRLRRLEDQ